MADEPPAELPERPLPPPTWRDVVDRVVAPERARLLRIGAAVTALAAVAAGGWWALRPPPAPAVEATLPFAPGAEGAGAEGAAVARPTPTTSTTPPADLVVHAAGAVAAPGVHRVPSGSRIGDLLVAAGGPAADVDLDRVNLAAPLADGQRIWFPRIGEEAPPAVAGVDGAAGTGGGAPTEAAPIDLNVATASELEALPGVGPAIAAAIVEHRERHGRFASVDDLLEVSGIGPARLEDLRDLVTV